MAESQPKVKALREMSETELAAQVAALRQDIWRSRVKTTEGASQQTHRFTVMRRQIARIFTILQERHVKPSR